MVFHHKLCGVINEHNGVSPHSSKGHSQMTNKRSARLKKTTEILSENFDEKRTPRHDYLLEREKIKNEIGDLEQIRMSLGLSQRRICMLLLVDPSAWTRWNKTEAPPHIYQALRWLIELRKINPEITAPSNIESRVDLLHASTQSKLRELENSVAVLERALALTATAQPTTSPDLTRIIELLTEQNALASAIEIPTPERIKVRRRKRDQSKTKAKVFGRANQKNKNKRKTSAKQKTKAKPKLRLGRKLKIKRKPKIKKAASKKRR